jgi:hypothetical protein
MHIFIDETGSFSGDFGTSSLSLVGALIIPDERLPNIEQRYRRIRPSLQQERGEVKGRLLDERNVAHVVDILVKNEAVFEATAIDLGLHRPADIDAHKQRQAEEITANLTERHHPKLAESVWKLRRRLEAMSRPLYVQSMANFDLISRILDQVVLYVVQRRPSELAAFHWVIDAKNSAKTDWEDWWSTVILPFFESASMKAPSPMLEGADYSYFDKQFRMSDLPEYKRKFLPDPTGKRFTDLGKLMTRSRRFSAEPEPGLELVDIVTNATRRALIGNLRIDGYGLITRLMIHIPRDSHCVHLIGLMPDDPAVETLPYRQILLRDFRRGMKSLIAPRFDRAAHRST